MHRKFFFPFCLLAITLVVSAQSLGVCFPSVDTGQSPVSASPDEWKQRYERADNFHQDYNTKYYNGVQQIQNITDTHCFWYLTTTPDGKEFLIIDAAKRTVFPAFDALRLADSLSVVTAKKTNASQLPFSSIRFSKDMSTLYFNFGGFDYTCMLENYSLSRRESRQRSQGLWSDVALENSTKKVKSPDELHEAYIVEGNVWITHLESGKKTQLSYDGSPGEYYSSEIQWSPDSKKLLSSRFRPAEVRKLLIIESSPADQLQPKTHEYDYQKPGDALPVRRPVAFNIETGTKQTFTIPDVEMQYSLNRIQWEDDSKEFTFHFNKRGHQQYVIYAANVETGNVRTVVDERSNTFIYYNWLYNHRLKSTNELLWISERDGWRHLYLYDFSTGKVKRQLTKGEWIVKRVVRVDEDSKTAILVACGMQAGEDPYLEKYYSLDLKSGNLKALTPEHAFHKVTFSSDYMYMVDYYSRADLVPTLVVRSVADGTVVFKPEQQPDISAALAAGWRMPEVFTAKGRDGKTDIWGMIIRPTDFDPTKKYPVIEYIYAGPHDSFVPKEFSISGRTSGLSELGFITVLIDGMGTANRSKAFHDVCWQNLKDAGFPDRIAWMKAAANRYPEMDLERVGIYGGSAGGQSSTGALLFHPDFYKVAVSSCGCHDNRMDKIWWNEQWMGYPIGKHYEESSNVVNAHLLKGNLMLILGELDNNVDPSSTLQVVDQLVKHNKEFEFVMLPGVGHSLGERYGERKRRDFFIRHLKGALPPNWNE
jgi:dipeptidyl aminopeptidase/acylaminoacyl peptidase